MALAEIGARLRLQGADSFRRDANRARDGVRGVGDQVDRTDRRLRGLQGSARRAGSAIASIGKGAALGGVGAAAVGVGALAAGLFQGFKDAAALQTVLAKTNAVVKSTGGVANVSAKGIVSMADELESLSGVDGDAIINAQNLLLTFTKVRNEVGETNHVFDQATRAAVDMAVALGQDPSAAAMQLGKALNDPVKGVSALGKAGVSFSEKQKKTIKTLVASNKVMEAQKIILGEMQVQFGGAAKAAGSGFEGAMARAKDAVGDMFRDTATPLLPGVTRQIERFSTFVNETATPAILDFIKGFQDETGAGGRFRDDLRAIWQEAKEVGGYAKTAYEKVKGLVDFMVDHKQGVKDFAVVLGAVYATLKGMALINAVAAASGIASVGAAAAIANPALLVTVGALTGLYLGLKKLEDMASDPLTIANTRAGVPTATTRVPSAPLSDRNSSGNGLLLDGKPSKGPVANLDPSNHSGPRVSAKVLAPRSASGSAPSVTPAPAGPRGDLIIPVNVGNREVHRVVVQNFRDEAARR